jgi:DHA2 family multidrug resistance protein
MVSFKAHTISRESPSYKWWMGITLAIGSMTVGFAERMVEIAIPQIMLALRVDLDRVQWIRTAPAIIRTILGPMVGWLVGIFGIRQLYIASFILYIICSGFAGTAWSLSALVFFLTLKNAGGGLRQPLSMSMMYQVFPSHQRGLAIGLYQASQMVGPLIAPLVGGWLVEQFGWRSVFYVNIPINFFALLLIMFLMPRDAETEKLGWPGSVDFIGLGTLTLCLSTLLLGVNNGRTFGWDSSYILGLFAVSAVSCVIFLIREFTTAHPIVEMRVFKNRSFSLSFLARLLNNGIFQSTNFVFGIFMQRDLRFSPLQAGRRLVPMAFTSAFGAVTWGMLADRISMPIVIALSLLASSITMYLYSQLDLGTSLTYIILVTIFQSLFRSGAQATMTTMALGTLPAEKVTLGAGLDSLAKSLGNTLGVPLITSYVTHQEATYLTKLMRRQNLDSETGDALAALQRSFEQAGESVDTARTRSQTLIRNQLIERASIGAYHDSFRLAAVAGLFIIPMVLFIRMVHHPQRRPRGFNRSEALARAEAARAASRSPGQEA